MFCLAHISDVHLGPLPPVEWSHLFSRRILGYINWHRNRAGKFSSSILNDLITHMVSAKPDHIAITGDLVNLALPEEIEQARHWLGKLGSGKRVSIVCGNHDAYVKGTLEEAFIAWQDHIIGDDGTSVIDPVNFPILRRRGPCSLILVNSALATWPFYATGVFDQHQAEKMKKILLQEKGNCRIILIHHPPFANATGHLKRLIGDVLFRDVVKKSGAELILHGHTHLNTLEWIEGPEKCVPVVCVPATGQGIGGKKPAAHYNWFRINFSNGWKIRYTRFGYEQGKTGIVNDKERLL